MQDDVENVREKVDLVEFIGQYTPLKQTGKNFKGLCPFHTEKSPSFFVRPDRGMFYCFGCQRGGDIYNFVMEKENISFGEALELLAKRAGVTLTQTRDPDRGEKKERIIKTLAIANDFFISQLHAEQGENAREYLNNRELSTETIQSFQLGFAPDSWDAVSTHLEKNGFQQHEIIDAGLAIPSSKSRKGSYDRFRNRVMFPIVDHLGRVVGFSGRALDNDDQAKYINTPETPVFIKGNVLYGYDKAHESAREKDYMILVEGNIDVVSLHQANITNVVAPLGTGFTSRQLTLLQRVSNRLMIVFDMDDAGRNATERAAVEAAAGGFEVKIATINGAKDPDEAVRQDSNAFKRDLTRAVPAFSYFLSRARSKHPGSSTYDVQHIAQYVFTYVAAVSDDSVREQLLEDLSRELGLSFPALKNDFNVWKKSDTSVKSTEKGNTATDKQIETPLSRQERLEAYILSLLLNVSDRLLDKNPVKERIQEVSDNIFTQAKNKSIFDTVRENLSKHVQDLTDGIQYETEDLQPYMRKLLMQDFGSLLDSEETAQHELLVTMDFLEAAHYTREIQRLSREMEKHDKDSEEGKRITEQIRQLTQKRRSISR